MAIKNLRTFCFLAKLPLSLLGMIDFLNTNLSLLLHPWKQCQSRIQSFKFTSWQRPNTIGCEQTCAVTVEEHATAREVCMTLSFRWKEHQGSTASLDLLDHHCLLSFLFVISYSLFKEPGLLMVMVCRRNDYYMPAPGKCAVFHMPSHLTQPVSSYYPHLLSQCLDQVSLLHSHSILHV